MKILVTGGAGYIGSFMVKRLVHEGHDVIVVDNLIRGHKEVVDSKATFEQGDISQQEFMTTLFSRYSFDAAIHFAGYISTAESMEKPGVYFRENAFNTLQLLDNMVRFNVKRIIFSSSAAVYGNPIRVPISEDHPLNPTSPYGESKLAIEKILRWYNECHDISSISLRYFNAAGAALDGSMGERHIPESHIIPIACEAINRGTEFVLYGDDYATKDGSCVRDYIHVLDLVEAHMCALNKLENNKGKYIYNVGTGMGYSNKEVLEMIQEVCKKTLTIKVEKRRLGDPERLIADPSKINTELHFSPQYSNLKTIVETAWKWYTNNLA